MDDVACDALTRRTSLVALGAGGLAALAGAVTGDAKNKARKKLEKRRQQKCLNQEGTCEASITAFCERFHSGNPDDIQLCLDKNIPCCQALATCDTTAFLVCIHS